MVLIYDGIHYDALFESKNGTEVAIHPSSDKRLFFLKRIKALAEIITCFSGMESLTKKHTMSSGLLLLCQDLCVKKYMFNCIQFSVY